VRARRADWLLGRQSFKAFRPDVLPEWTGARVAKGDGLLSRLVRKCHVGSNPTLSASECVTASKRGVVPTLTSKLAGNVPGEVLAAPRSRKAASVLSGREPHVEESSPAGHPRVAPVATGASRSENK
jgi:hypothetical protein